ncbi:hypothetical protein E7681_17730 [Thalassobius vesicularis]|uniref:Uncharacterized protein n=1 Tax=Thalassobius vesicularis TaxID=1294297 RepID=A0A4S3M540_9RHOB|nr:hypothetical protein [Thalassobius vesicularis]THD71640.1 hypothetical protein E7681_17730 [Thalassobius vesicularis]
MADGVVPVWLTALSGLVPLVAVFFQHRWTVKSFSVSEEQEEFRIEVGRPLLELSTLAEDLEDKLEDWQKGRGGETYETIQSAGKKLSRKVNRFVNYGSKSGFGNDLFWSQISTDDFDEIIFSLDAHSTAIHIATVQRNLDRLKMQCENCLSLKPKSVRKKTFI